jgi:hypothetical protein
MAEINVQRKNASLWLGMIAAIAVVLLAWVLAETWAVDDDGRERAGEAVQSAPETAPTSGVTRAPRAEVAAFLTFTETSDGPATGPAHDFTAAGIRRLSTALDGIAKEEQVGGRNVRERLQAFRQIAERIQADPGARDHADRVRAAFMSAANVMAAMQQDRWPDAADMRNDVQQVRTAAGALDAGRPLLEQLPEVRECFERSAVVVRAMAERT